MHGEGAYEAHVSWKKKVQSIEAHKSKRSNRGVYSTCLGADE